jgi:hypothetical protein
MKNLKQLTLAFLMCLGGYSQMNAQTQEDCKAPTIYTPPKINICDKNEPIYITIVGGQENINSYEITGQNYSFADRNIRNISVGPIEFKENETGKNFYHIITGNSCGKQSITFVTINLIDDTDIELELPFNDTVVYENTNIKLVPIFKIDGDTHLNSRIETFNIYEKETDMFLFENSPEKEFDILADKDKDIIIEMNAKVCGQKTKYDTLRIRTKRVTGLENEANLETLDFQDLKFYDLNGKLILDAKAEDKETWKQFLQPNNIYIYHAIDESGESKSGKYMID